MVTGRFGPTRAILKWVVSARVLEGPFFILAWFFHMILAKLCSLVD